MVRQLVIFSLLFIVASCTGTPKQNLSDQVSDKAAEIESSETDMKTDMKKDSIYRTPHSAARLDNVRKFFAENSKFKDWPSTNAKVVMVRCVAWKDGTTSDTEILRASGVDELDNEAIRLVNLMKLTPARNQKGEPINSYFTIPVSFP